jgi:hypothetical protein
MCKNHYKLLEGNPHSSITEQGECEKVAGDDREDWKVNQNSDR